MTPPAAASVSSPAELAPESASPPEQAASTRGKTAIAASDARRLVFLKCIVFLSHGYVSPERDVSAPI